MKTYKITPIGKPRMTHRDKHRPIHKRYFKFCEDVKRLKISFPYKHAHIIFVLPMPKFWTKGKKKSLIGELHQQTPDVDNLFKSLADAIYKNDSHIADVRITKVWGNEGSIIIK